MWFRSLCHLPELICYKNHTTLQEQRSKDPDDLTNTEALEKAFEVHVFQARVHGPPQLNDLNTSNKHQSASLVRTDSARGTWHLSPSSSAPCFPVEGTQRTIPILFCKLRLEAQCCSEMAYYTIHYQVILLPRIQLCALNLLSFPREA